MKQGWTYKTLGDITSSMADGPFGSNLKKEHYTDKPEVRIIQLSNIGEDGWREENTKYTTFEHLKSIQRSEVQPGDIVIAKMMPAGRAILCPSHEAKFVLSSDAVRATLIEGVNRRFVLYSINSPYFRKQVYENVSGSGRVRTSLTKLKACRLLIPGIDEQERIVERLDAAFAQIDELKSNAERQLAEARALFQSALKEMLAPKEGWVEKKMSELYDVRDGTHDSPKYHETGYPLVTSKNLRGGILDMSNVSLISEEDYKAINIRSKVDIGDVLFAMIGTIGNPVYVQTEPNYAIKNMALFKVPPTQSGEFLRYYLLNNNVLLKMQNESKGTTQKFVSLGYLRNFLVRIPNLSEQKQLVSRLDSLKSKVDCLQENFTKISQECDAMKQALLRQIFE